MTMNFSLSRDRNAACSNSAGAAGQSCDILPERQRRELQALDRGEIRKDRLSEIIDREAVPDRERCGLDAVSSFRREEMRAEQPAVACIGDELDQPPRVARGKRAWHLIETDRRDTNLTSGRAGRGLGQADARYLRVGEHDGRHRAVVVAQLVAVEGVAGRELGAVGGHIDELVASGDVAGCDQFVYMAAYGAKLAASNALNGDKLRYDNRAMPAIVFTDPQVASVGLTEAAA